MIRITWGDGSESVHEDAMANDWKARMKIRNGRIVKVEKDIGSLTICELSRLKDRTIDITDICGDVDY